MIAEVLLLLFGAAFTVAAAWGLGRALLVRLGVALRRDEWPVIAFLVGSAALSGIVFALAAARLAYPAAFLVVGMAAVAAGVRAKPSWKGPERGGFAWPWLLPFAPFLVLYLCRAMAPEASPDGASYHLSLVAQYHRAHGLVRIANNFYASLSQGMEMLFLFAFAFGRHSAAAMVHLAFLAALAWSMACYGRRAGFPLVGGCAALLVFASPVVGIDAASAYNDVALAAVVFAVFQLLEIWDSERQPGLIAPIGLLAGFAYAVKYTGGLAVPYALGFLLWRGRRWRPVTVAGLCAALLIAPWMVKNWLWVANPLAPFFNGLFPNPYVTAAFEQEYRERLSIYDLKSRWEIPLQVTVYGSLSGLLGPVFLLAPLALAALARREGRRLLAAAAVFGATYFSNIGTRFLIPPLPFLSLAMMLAASRVRGAAPATALLHAALSWPEVVPRYARHDAWRIQGFPWRQALRIVPADPYLEQWLTHYGAARLIERTTPPGASIFTFTPIPEAYTSRRILVAYQSAENKMSGGLLWTAVQPDYAPTWRLRFAFARRPLDAIRVVQAGSGTRDLWNIHELRFLDGGRELARAPRWRLTAQPYPWGIQDAFDNSLLTFWICGEWIRPGQYVQVEFGASETADSALIETAADQAGIRLTLEGRAPGQGWMPLAVAPEISSGGRPLRLRRAAAEELKRRGIDYLLVFDSEVGATDMQRNPELWGVQLVGQDKQARLYQLP